MIVDEQRLEAAMVWLAGSDQGFAEQKAALANAEILRKRVRARIFLTSEGPVATREATAETNPEVLAADDGYIAALKEFETTKARRQRAELVIEVWRSLESSRRKSV